MTACSSSFEPRAGPHLVLIDKRHDIIAIVVAEAEVLGDGGRNVQARVVAAQAVRRSLPNVLGVIVAERADVLPLRVADCHPSCS